MLITGVTSPTGVKVDAKGIDRAKQMEKEGRHCVAL